MAISRAEYVQLMNSAIYDATYSGIFEAHLLRAGLPRQDVAIAVKAMQEAIGDALQGKPLASLDVGDRFQMTIPMYVELQVQERTQDKVVVEVAEVRAHRSRPGLKELILRKVFPA